MLFSFRGRALRAHYWAEVGVNTALFLAVVIAIASTAGIGAERSELSGGVALALLLIPFLAVWTYLAVGVKRWHDRDKSGAWMFLLIVPFGPL